MPMKEKTFLNPTVTVDIVLFTIEKDMLKVLLINRARDPFAGVEALPGGYLLKGETTKTAAARILEEKVGVTDIYMEQLYTFDTEGRDPRGPVFSVTYMALVPSPIVFDQSADDIQAPAFYDVRRLPKLAFDHKQIVAYAIERLRGKMEYTTIGFNALPEYFTLSQLQKTYETILNTKLDKRNFRKKIEQFGFVKETKKMLSGQRHRPAKLYTKSIKSNEIKLF